MKSARRESVIFEARRELAAKLRTGSTVPVSERSYIDDALCVAGMGKLTDIEAVHLARMDRVEIEAPSLGV